MDSFVKPSQFFRFAPPDLVLKVYDNEIVWYQNPRQITTIIIVCLFEILRPAREIFTHMEKSALSVKVCKFWPKLGTHGNSALRVLYRDKLLWHGTSVYNGHHQGPVIFTPISEDLAVELSLRLIMLTNWYVNSLAFCRWIFSGWLHRSRKRLEELPSRLRKSGVGTLVARRRWTSGDGGRYPRIATPCR